MTLFSQKPAAFFLLAFVVASVFIFQSTNAATIGGVTNFNVDSDYDVNERSQVSAELVKSSSRLNFYVEKAWWDLQVAAKKTEILDNLEKVSFEFGNKIYPTLTSVFGQEWNPGVDGDEKITVLLHVMKEGIGGYFRSADGYVKLQIPNSNEREMVYLPVANIDNVTLKLFLAHEFTHLITFNQKDRLQGVSEEIWLNEMRAEYALTVLGYNNPYEGSNLQKRMKDFLTRSSDSVTEWLGSRYDYASIGAFGQYVMDHYGINIFSDSIKSKSVGIASINEVLQKNGYQKSFSEIFADWTVAAAINDCSIDFAYCYLNVNLKGLKVSPELIFLPVSSNSSLSVTNVTKNWTGNWQKIIGGKGDLHLKFSSIQGLDFKVPYIIFDRNDNIQIKFLELNDAQEGEIIIKDFGGQYVSLLLMPSLQSKTEGFAGQEFTYPYTFTISISGQVDGDEFLVQKLLAQIESLKKQIAAIKSQAVLGQSTSNGWCVAIASNLYLGITGGEVSCLQQFLKSQGPEIYPEGKVTGFFGGLTKAAVIRFQERYAPEILTPIGLSKGTGYVGTLTKNKINQLMKP